MTCQPETGRAWRYMLGGGGGGGKSDRDRQASFMLRAGGGGGRSARDRQAHRQQAVCLPLMFTFIIITC